MLKGVEKYFWLGFESLPPLKLKDKKIQISCDGGAATGKSTGAKIIAKKYKLSFLSSGLLYRYASYLLIKYTVQWIQYYNQTDPRMPNSIWRYTCDYKVIGTRDICDLDDKPFVRQRRK